MTSNPRPTGIRSRLVSTAIFAALLITAGIGAAWRFGAFDGPMERGRKAYARGLWDETEQIARGILRAAPGELEARRLLARSLARSGRAGQAVPIYRGFSFEQLAGEDLLLLGQSLLEQGDKEHALDALESAVSVDPDDPEILLALMRFREENEQPIVAAELARRVAKLPDGGVVGWVELARLEEVLDSPAEALAAWDEALQLDPTLRKASITPDEAVIRAAKLELRLSRPDRALLRLGNRTDATAERLRSRAHLQLGQVGPAELALERAGGPNSSDPIAHEPSPYVGAAKCAECHDAVASAQRSSRHAKTFRLGTDLAGLELPAEPVPDPGIPEVRHRFLRGDDGRVRVETKAAGDATYLALVDFAFGSGDRGLTLVGRDHAGGGRELRLSHYADGELWDVTFGQAPRPRDEADLVGRSLTLDGVRRCVGCHVTHPGLGIDREGPEAQDGAIGCERCHGPGGNHVKAVELEFSELAIARPKAAVGPAIVGLCADCHKPKGEITREMPAVIRFQAATLAWSRCSTESFGKLDCVSCHDPHRNASTSKSHYESRCLTCHDPAGRVDPKDPRSPDPRMNRVACSVNPRTGCIECHMPADVTSIAHSSFTDHEIKIHRTAPTLPPPSHGKPDTDSE
ncbi:MAG: tetratricopeptide repeat protein [Isosphaeraceae bacterium]|nr:tetratricopeptide repeat protein [Isosphaeraceae bacterium]